MHLPEQLRRLLDPATSDFPPPPELDRDCIRSDLELPLGVLLCMAVALGGLAALLTYFVRV